MFEKYVKRVTLRNGSKVTLRPLKKEDLNMLVDFFLNIGFETEKYFHPFPFTREQAEKIIRELDYEKFFPVVAVEEKERRIVGMVFLSPFKRGEVSSLGIGLRHDYRGLGLGSRLMEFIIEVAKDYGVREIRLSVYADNCRAIALYCKFGFEVYEVRKKAVYLKWDGKYHTVYLMSLELGI
ncbi:MAG: hypothetical protein DRJ36_00405 [Thermoprotei archaeon]|nr:MAG: hypothetical protein DRJ36_00405 [Thermoprotei archaeon]